LNITKKIKFILSLFPFAFLLLVPLTSEAKILFVPSFSFLEQYNDNVLYQDLDEIESFVSIYNPGLTIGATKGRNILLLDYGFFFTNYENQEARKIRSKYHHAGTFTLDYFLTDKLELSASSWQRYSDAISIVDFEHEIVKKKKVFKSFNSSSLVYNYRKSSRLGLNYKFIYFKYFADELSLRERNHTHRTGGFINHSFNARNAIDINYSYDYGKYFTNDGDKFLGRRKVHNGNISYTYKINSSLSTSLSFLTKYIEYPFPEEELTPEEEELALAEEETEFQRRKHIFQEVRTTLGYKITDRLNSSYWIGYNSNELEFADKKENYSNYTGGMRFDFTWRKIILNAVASYEIRENLFYTISERLGDYRSTFGGLNARIGTENDKIILNIYANGRERRYRTTRTIEGELRRETIIYCGGMLKVLPTDWLYLSVGYDFSNKGTNVRDDVYAYTNNRAYFKITITFPSRKALPVTTRPLEREAEWII